jgi:purine catabolism regulator
VEAGNEFGLPIIELGKEIKYIDVMYPVMAELFNKQGTN